MNIDFVNINKKLEEIFETIFELNFGAMEADAKNLNLMGTKIRMRSRDLLNLFFEIEKSFGISIPQEDILKGRFNTFNNILEIVRSQHCEEKNQAI